MTAGNVTAVKRIVRDAIHGHVRYLRRSDRFRWRTTVSHRYGQTAQEFASRIQGSVSGVTLLAASEHWRPWPEQSYFEVVFTVTPPRFR